MLRFAISAWMEIGLDARTLVGERTGVGNYLKNILEAGGFNGHLVHGYYLPAPDEKLPEVVVPNRTEFRWRPLEFPSWIDHVPESLAVIWWVNVTLYRALSRDGIECFFAPNFVQPLPYGGPSIAVIHDLAHVNAPATHERTYRLYLRVFLSGTVRRADRIVTVSKHTKRDVVEHYGVSPNRVSVCYGAADDRFHPRSVSDTERSEVIKRYNLPSTAFLLYVGNIEPRKNLHMLIEALQTLDPSDRLPLVIVGKRHLSYERLQRALRRYDGEVVFTGYVPDNDLPILYNLAAVFTYPSLYEGFGLPVLEAMQSGTPVLVSDRASLPEVVGDAGVVVDPTDAVAIGVGITELLDESHSSRFAACGLRRAEQFTWEESAARLNRLSEKVN